MLDRVDINVPATREDKGKRLMQSICRNVRNLSKPKPLPLVALSLSLSLGKQRNAYVNHTRVSDFRRLNYP
jgi:hypothetical protein